MDKIPLHNGFENRVIVGILHNLVMKEILTRDEARSIYQQGDSIGAIDVIASYILKK